MSLSRLNCTRVSTFWFANVYENVAPRWPGSLFVGKSILRAVSTPSGNVFWSIVSQTAQVSL